MRQLSYLDTSTLSVRVVNAAGAETQGAEVDFQWSTPVDGLVVRGAAAYLDAEYTDYVADCYNGQSIANGCSLTPNATGAFTKQNGRGEDRSELPRHLEQHPLLHRDVRMAWRAAPASGRG